MKNKSVIIGGSTLLMILLSIIGLNYPLLNILRLNREFDMVNYDLTPYLSKYSIIYISKSECAARPLRLSAIYTIPLLFGKKGEHRLDEMLTRQGNYINSNRSICMMIKHKYDRKELFEGELISKLVIYKIKYMYYNDEDSLQYILKSRESDDSSIREEANRALMEICKKMDRPFCRSLGLEKTE